MKKSILGIALLAATLFGAPAQAGRPAIDEARAKLMRLHIRLYSEAINAPQVTEAQRAAGQAYSAMYLHRTDVLTRLYQTQEYKDLRLALYHTQRRLTGVREEIPVRIQKIMDGATDALAVRVQITQLESNALEADAAFVEARDQANALNAAYRRVLRDSLATIKSNPEFMSLSDQVASLQQSITGMRSVSRMN